MSGTEENVPLLIYLISGCLAGAIEETAMWPLEYIKTQLQLQKKLQKAPLALLDENKDGMVVAGDEGIDMPVLRSTEPRKDGLDVVAASADDDVPAPPLPAFEKPPLYNNMVTGIIYTVRTFGFFALYRGLTPTLLGSFPKAGIRFGLFSYMSDLLRDEAGVLSMPMCFLAGLIAGVVEALLVVAPVETVKTKCIQLNLPFLKGLKQIVLLEGMPGLYNGALATVCKQGSNHALRFLWFNTYKQIVTHDGLYPLTPVLAFLGGMSAGVFSTLGNQPFDVIKTRMQGVRVAYTSTWDCVCQTMVREGIPGFYTGIVPRLSRVVPGQGIIFMSYESIVTLLLFIGSG